MLFLPSPLSTGHFQLLSEGVALYHIFSQQDSESKNARSVSLGNDFATYTVRT
jgi:hypothetical protein